MVKRGFESRLELEFSDFSIHVTFSEARRRGFLRVLRFPPLLHRLMVSVNKYKAKINAISTRQTE